MDPVTIGSFSAFLNENPMNILDIPESIFEVFESDGHRTGDYRTRRLSSSSSSVTSSALPSLHCSRCQSGVNLAGLLNEYDEFDDLLDLESNIPSIVDDQLQMEDLMSNLELLKEEQKDEDKVADIFSSDHQDTVLPKNDTLPKRPSAMDLFSQGNVSDQCASLSQSAPSTSCNDDDHNLLFDEEVRRLPRNVSESSLSSRDSSLNSRPVSRIGKTKKRTHKRHVLHFIKDILENPTMESIASWKNKEKGSFKILDPDKVLSLWNKGKTRSAKNWNNFAKTLMRHYKGHGEDQLFPDRQHFVWRFSLEFMQSHAK